MKSYWQQRYARLSDARAPGSLDLDDDANRQLVAVTQRHLEHLLRTDFAAPRGASVLDLGCGVGDYARAVERAGFGTYLGLDFAAPTPGGFRAGYAFADADITAPDLDLSRRFSLVLLLDVAFHVIDDDSFARMIDNVRRHAEGYVYITGLFRDAVLARHVRHRRLECFKELGSPVDLHPWRDTMLIRFDARNHQS
jgi:SAM-dependent methyltransferase